MARLRWGPAAGEPASVGSRAEAVADLAPATGDAPPAGSSGYRAWVTAIAGILLLPMAVVATLTFSTPSRIDAANAAAARLVSPTALEEEYGIRVNLVAVTAEGGLVDVRFTVVDKFKAEELFHDSTTMPVLYIEAKGAVLAAPAPMAHHINLLDGASYFLLYPNSGGTVQEGTAVSVVISNVRLAAVAAQS